MHTAVCKTCMHTVWRNRWMDGWIDGRMDGWQMFRRFRVACSCVTVCVFLILGEVGGGGRADLLAGRYQNACVRVCVSRTRIQSAHTHADTHHTFVVVYGFWPTVCAHTNICIDLCVYTYTYTCTNMCIVYMYVCKQMFKYYTL